MHKKSCNTSPVGIILSLFFFRNMPTFLCFALLFGTISPYFFPAFCWKADISIHFPKNGYSTIFDSETAVIFYSCQHVQLRSYMLNKIIIWQWCHSKNFRFATSLGIFDIVAFLMGFLRNRVPGSQEISMLVLLVLVNDHNTGAKLPQQLGWPCQ